MLSVVCQHERVIEVSFSYSPEDSITALAEAVDAVGIGPAKRVVALSGEPETVDIVLERVSPDSAVALSFVRYRDHRRDQTGEAVLSLEVAPLDLVRATWRALRRLEAHSRSGDYEREWRHSFPDRQVAILESRFV